MSESLSDKKLDPEWVDLFLYALEIGISPDEIRIFFGESSRPE
ncbi:anti-repressor SinI family protein [Metabacillus bambusae]|uniref:Anti-repressor SinI family protein n=1 Tax=Metabacillus bambusae TaxID=2795218 RepID=A0ABS3N4P5_9BACI|nr:anti-repressor SinI family protein [Metabacillus bambusae]MBO1513242.1 anti-repressor SinI family protein [Metabacillus bambusae]